MPNSQSWNGYRRIQAALRGEWPDRRPVMLHNFMHATREAGLKLRDYYTNGEVAAQVHIDAVERYGLDGVLLDIDTAVLAEAVGVPVDHPEDLPPRVRQPLLPALEAIKDRPPPDIGRSPRVQVWLDAASRLKDYFGDEVFLRGNCDQAPFSLASMMRGTENWMFDIVLDADNAIVLLDYCMTASLQFINLMSRRGVHMVSNGDSPAGPDLISPDMYRRFAKRYEQKLCERAHLLGLPYLMHICGKTDRILDDFAEMGFDAVELDYKADIHQIHEKLSERMTLFGNIDPTGVLTDGTPATVAEKVTELLDVYAERPRLVVNAGCAIPATAPPENVRSLVEVTHHWQPG